MKTCPNCGEDEIEGTNGFFCGSLEGTSGRVYHTASCMRLKNRPRRSFEVIKQLESERDALQARVKRLEEAGDAMAFGEGEFVQYARVWIDAKESKP